MLEFRPHHFLCTVGFQGKGYSPEFVRNYTVISNELKGQGFEKGYEEKSIGDHVKIRVVDKTDSICAPCPSKRGDLCETQAKIEALDSAHRQVLGLRTGEEITWSRAKALIAEKFTPEKFESACAACSWKPMGVCKSALLELQKSHLGTLPRSEI